MTDVGWINEYLQKRLTEEQWTEVGAVEAASWLEEAELLPDSKSRPGWNLRELLREGCIDGQVKLPNRRWLIRVVEAYNATLQDVQSINSLYQIWNQVCNHI